MKQHYRKLVEADFMIQYGFFAKPNPSEPASAESNHEDPDLDKICSPSISKRMGRTDLQIPPINLLIPDR